jgi:hypothetical protein
MLGFFVRWGAFRREKRLEIYREYLAAFIDLVRAAEISLSGGGAHDVQPAVDRYELAAIDLRLVSTRHLQDRIAAIDHFVLHRVKPLLEAGCRRGDPHVDLLDVDALELARGLADKGRRDVSGLGLPV